MRAMRIADVGVLVAFALLGATACSSTPMVGKTAPALTGTEWVLPIGTEAPDLSEEGWKIFTFFSPKES